VPDDMEIAAHGALCLGPIRI